MSDFPHLKLPYKIEGIPKPGRAFTNKSQTTVDNELNRQVHGKSLYEKTQSIKNEWNQLVLQKTVAGIDLPNKNDIPVFLQIDTEVFSLESLLNWGIEIISEETNGYIIGSSIDGLEAFNNNLEQFLNEKGTYKNTAAKIHNIESDYKWRLQQILKGDLAKKWENIVPDRTYTIELSVSCSVIDKTKFPDKSNFDSEDIYNASLHEYDKLQKGLEIERGEKQILRESEIEKYLSIYEGTLHSIWDNEVDAIFFKISIDGNGLKDLVLTYQYVYEVQFSANYEIENISSDFMDDYNLNLLPPSKTASKVCIIDSGIEESHRLISPAIDPVYSKSYVDGDVSRADYVRNSGHGTKVAGSVLYPYSIPKNGNYQLESVIQNARILDHNNEISNTKFVPALLEEIVNDFAGTRIFNLSVCEKTAFLGVHMPALAASIDKLSNKHNILFIISAGNLFKSSLCSINPGISEFIAAGKKYPDYLNESSCKIANPAVSYFGITVGSISMNSYEDENYKTLAGNSLVSPFSRVGMGIWENMKPDVVEFGGDYLKHKITDTLIVHEDICPELVNSTMYGSNAVGKNDVGTSFSTPKVSYIASKLQSLHPNETSQMYRALIIHSARLPEHCFQNPSYIDFCHYGYGIPNLERALNNESKRITFIQNGNIAPKNADIYRINIPNSLKGEGKNFRILVEVTLAFTAKIRQTRKGSHSYLSSWLEWKSSKYNESFNSFRHKTIDYLDIENPVPDDGSDAIKWCIRENPKWSNNNINRNNSTVQKSWAIIEPHQFANEFSLSVIGHIGWDKNLGNKIPYALCVSFEILDSEMSIYNILAEAQIELETRTEIEQEQEQEQEVLRAGSKQHKS